METDVQFEGADLIVTRIYDAPIDEVFDAWIETSKLKQWWGCAECTDVRSEVQPKVGGAYNHHMKIETPHGVHEAPQLATFSEYDPPRKIAYRSPDENDPMTVTVTFREVEGGTEVRLVHAAIPDITVEGDVPMREIIRSGWTAAFGKLHGLFDESKAA